MEPISTRRICQSHRTLAFIACLLLQITACGSGGVTDSGAADTSMLDVGAMDAVTASDHPVFPEDCIATPENNVATCTDQVDNDCDGYVDCDDFSCNHNPDVAACNDGGTVVDAGCVRHGAEDNDSACADGIDNDCNGYTDCRDFNCSRSTSVRVCCTPSGDEATDALCMDGIDNDCDGYVDCRDFGCSRNPGVTVCRPPCTATGTENTNAACSDGIDNDCNGYVDCLDFGCSRTTAVTVCRTGAMVDCSPCLVGSDCMGGVCASYTDRRDLRFCTRRCTTNTECVGSPVTRCVGGICVTNAYTYACSADLGSYTVRDACGLVRTYTCTSPERCVMIGTRAECAPPGSCQGTPTDCGLRSASCSGGCSTTGSCSGSAQSCGSYYGSSACRQQDGCNWSGSISNECRGSANSCSSYSSDYGCNSQDGCRWTLRCTGSPTACASFTSSTTCGGQPGCYWR